MPDGIEINGGAATLRRILAAGGYLNESGEISKDLLSDFDLELKRVGIATIGNSSNYAPEAAHHFFHRALKSVQLREEPPQITEGLLNKFDLELKRLSHATFRKDRSYALQAARQIFRRALKSGRLREESLQAFTTLPRFAKAKFLSHHPEFVTGGFFDPTLMWKYLCKAKCPFVPLSRIIPIPPQPCYTHPYTQIPREFVGRTAEYLKLSNWINESLPQLESICVLYSLGGTGKSALSWEWVNRYVINGMHPIRGFFWWSFQGILEESSEASFENFVLRALAYTTSGNESELRKLDLRTREELLLRQLDQQPFLLVLDGFEELLCGYSRAFQAQQSPQTVGVPNFHDCSDVRHSAFLTQLARVRKTSILLNTRHVPSNLRIGENCAGWQLEGLCDDDAISLWKNCGVTGSRTQLIPIFWSIKNSPLFIKALATTVQNFRKSPGNFQAWRKATPKFNPAAFSTEGAKAHILKFALQGLTKKQRHVLTTMAFLHQVSTWEILSDILVQSKRNRRSARDVALRISEDDLVFALAGLEMRDLCFWDRATNQYDMHPIVRSVIRSEITGNDRIKIGEQLCAFFQNAAKVASEKQISEPHGLLPFTGLYYSLIEIGRLPTALSVFHEHIEKILLWRFGQSHRVIELLDTIQMSIEVDAPIRKKSNTLNTLYPPLGMAYQMIGELGSAIDAFHMAKSAGLAQMNDYEKTIPIDYHLAVSIWWTGRLAEGEVIVRQGIISAREKHDFWLEGRYLWLLAVALAARGDYVNSRLIFERVRLMLARHGGEAFEGVIDSFLALQALWAGDGHESVALAKRAYSLIPSRHMERDAIRAARLIGESLISMKQWDDAESFLRQALLRARSLNFVEEELPAITALADLCRRKAAYSEAHELLCQVWPIAERGPYPIFQADARLVKSRLELDQGHTELAKESAIDAYTFASCDGPPFCYASGVRRAQELLGELRFQVPDMQRRQIPPMPVVELNPNDDFYVARDPGRHI